VNQVRDQAMAQVGEKAEQVCEGFQDLACSFVLDYLVKHGPTSGEKLTIACRHAGIIPHDDRAFGPVYYSLVRQKRIVKVGSVRRERGHGTSGGNIWSIYSEQK